MRSRKNWFFLPALACFSASIFSASIVAVPCNTPPTVAAEAVLVEGGRPLIVDVLAMASDPDGQALAVSILSTTCPAQVSAVVDQTQTITISANVVVPPCRVRYQVDDGAGGTAATNINVSVDLGAIFADGFELGSTSAWSSTSP